MSAFVSARDLEADRQARKEQKREMRDEILREAKQSYERQKKHEELKRARGEDTWMLPAVNKRLGFKGDAVAPEKKKRKKKKDKESGKKSKKTSVAMGKVESGEGESGEEEDMWVEKGSEDSVIPLTSGDHTSGSVAPEKAPLSREEWMTAPLGPSALSLSILDERNQKKERKEEEEKKRALQCFDKPGQHPRELNPFWRDGGTGLPSKQNKTAADATPQELISDRSPRTIAPKQPAAVCSDRGHSWLLRAYKRAIEQSQETGRSLEKIAAERWGSMERLNSLLHAAGINPNCPDIPLRGKRREYLYSRSSKVDDKRRGELFESSERRERTREGGERWRREWEKDREERRGRERDQEERKGRERDQEERRGRDRDQERKGRERDQEERRGRERDQEERRGRERDQEERREREGEGIKMRGKEREGEERRVRERGEEREEGGWKWREREREWDGRQKRERDEKEGGRWRKGREESGEGGKERVREAEEKREGERQRRERGRETGREGREEREGSSERRGEGDKERRKREWKERFKTGKPRNEESEEFLKPGDLESTDVPSAPTATIPLFDSSQGWRKKMSSPSPVPSLSDEDSGKNQRGSQPTHSPSDIADVTMSTSDTGVAARATSRSDVDDKVSSVQTQEVADPVTDAQLNSLGAKLMKAELLGNTVKIEHLKKALERLRELKKIQEEVRETVAPKAADQVREERTLLLTKTDRFGREKPLQLSTSSSRYAQPSRAPSHSKKGKRERYFHDDDRYSLKDLVEQERMMTAEETQAAITRMASKFVPASNTDETIDDAVESKKAMRYNAGKEEERAKNKAVWENRKMAETIEKCQLCFDSPSFSKHLLIAVGMNAYICAPWHTSLTEGHCYIVPMEHTTCCMFLDENVWSEIEIFRKGLTRMFSDRGMDVVFMETFTSVKRRAHMYIDCIPVPREEGTLLPMYFKKAILESDEEWAQNKKLISTKEKGVRRSLPTGLPYFFAEFGTDGGFGHVIEDPDLFPHYFGREVVGGLMDLPPRLWLKPQQEHFEKQREKVLQLSQWWSPYDWTQRLQQ